MENNKATNNIQFEVMLSIIQVSCISCKSRDGYKNRIVRPSIENATSAKVSGSFGSKCLLHKRRALLILLKKCWESLAVCKELVFFIRKRALLKNAHRASTSQ